MHCDRSPSAGVWLFSLGCGITLLSLGACDSDSPEVPDAAVSGRGGSGGGTIDYGGTGGHAGSAGRAGHGGQDGSCNVDPRRPGSCCGDHIVSSDEECDDGNRLSGDGCSRTCDVEVGWHCPGGKDPCTRTSGDAACTDPVCRQDRVCARLETHIPCRCGDRDSSELAACPASLLRGLFLPDNADSCIAHAISGDGSTVVGECSTVSPQRSARMLWSSDSSPASLTFASDFDVYEAVNFDGSVVAGNDRDGAFRIVGGNIERLPAGNVTSISADGVVVAGSCPVAGGTHACMWTQQDGWRDLGTLDEPDDGSYARAISANGEVVVGGSNALARDNRARAFRWSAQTGMQPLPIPNGARESEATGVNADGSRIAGIIWLTPETTRSVVWTDAGVEVLEQASDQNGSGAVVAADARVLVYDAGGDSLGRILMLRDASGATRPIRELISAAGIENDDWFLNGAVALSADGTTLVGTVQHASDGKLRPFLMRL